MCIKEYYVMPARSTKTPNAGINRRARNADTARFSMRDLPIARPVQ
jgi:hypothetical protein